MTRYTVIVPVTGYVEYEVEAPSPEEAKELVASGEGEPTHNDIDKDMDTNNWTVEAKE